MAKISVETRSATIDLNGQVTKLREGDQPVILADGKNILYKDSRLGRGRHAT